MPYDFDNNLSAGFVYRVLKNGVRPGSIIALHDNKKSMAPLILDEFIDYWLVTVFAEMFWLCPCQFCVFEQLDDSGLFDLSMSCCLLGDAVGFGGEGAYNEERDV